jgi:hypothetical protein
MPTTLPKIYYNVSPPKIAGPNDNATLEDIEKANFGQCAVVAQGPLANVPEGHPVIAYSFGRDAKGEFVDVLEGKVSFTERQGGQVIVSFMTEPSAKIDHRTGFHVGLFKTEIER